MRIAFALVLTAFVGSAVGAVIPRGGEPEKSVSKGNGDDAFSGDFFTGSHETWNEKDKSTSDKNEKKNHEAQELSKQQTKTNEDNTHDGTDDLWTKQHVKGNRKTQGKELDETVNKDHSDQSKKAQTLYNPDGSIKQTGTNDLTVNQHYDANRQQKQVIQTETLEGDSDAKEHKVDHDTANKVTDTVTDKASHAKDSGEKSQKDQSTSEKEHQKDTFAASGGSGFYDFDKNGFGSN